LDFSLDGYPLDTVEKRHQTRERTHLPLFGKKRLSNTQYGKQNAGQPLMHGIFALVSMSIASLLFPLFGTLMASSHVPGAQTITRAVRALKLIAQHAPGGMRLTDLAAEMELERPTAHRLLQALMSEGMLVREGSSRRYTLGPLVFELGLASAHQFNLGEICQPVLEKLARQTQDTSFLFVQSGNDAVCLSRVQGTFPIQTPAVPVGSRQPLGVSAGGLALLSCLPDKEVSRTLASIAPRLSVYGDLDVEELRSHCTRARENGFAFISNKAVPGVSAVGLPILSSTGSAIAAITVAATQARLTEKRAREILPMLQDAAARIMSLLRQ
jgi:DNA-binding IclR family transcriptional regulator